jgi:hypothetical protein
MRKKSGLISLFDRIILYSPVAIERHCLEILCQDSRQPHGAGRAGRLAEAVRSGIRTTSGNDRPVLRISPTVHRPMFTIS